MGCPEDGTYKIIIVGGGSSYLKIVTRTCVEGEVITYHIGRGGYNDRGTSNGFLNGGGVTKDEIDRPADLDLSLDMIRILVINSRAGLYDK